MASLDIFNSNAFSMVTLTDKVNKVPFKPNWLGSLGLFRPRPVTTESVAVEEKGGVIGVIQTSERGAPISERSDQKRVLRNFNTVRIAQGQTIYAHEIQSIRAFGSESELQQVANKIAEVSSGPDGIMANIDLTHESMRLGAVQGVVLDADGGTIINWFDEFGISQAAEIDFDLDNASPVSGALHKKCNQVRRQMSRAAKGARFSGIVAICGDAFWDDLVTHPEVRETYLATQQAAALRNDVGGAFETFRFGQITWTNYRGTDDNSEVAVPTDKVKFFPIGTGIFQVALAPAEFFPFVNRPGRPVYQMIVRDKDRDAWVRPEMYSYPLHICTRPGMLQRGKRT